jgi:hypothetical protein
VCSLVYMFRPHLSGCSINNEGSWCLNWNFESCTHAIIFGLGSIWITFFFMWIFVVVTAFTSLPNLLSSHVMKKQMYGPCVKFILELHTSRSCNLNSKSITSVHKRIKSNEINFSWSLIYAKIELSDHSITEHTGGLLWIIWYLPKKWRE